MVAGAYPTEIYDFCRWSFVGYDDHVLMHPNREENTRVRFAK